MCFRVCRVITWQLACFFLAIIFLVISFVFGPLHTILYLSGQREELDTLIVNEQIKAIFFIFIIVVMWMIFLSSLLLLLSVCKRSLFIINWYIFWTLIHVIGTFIFCVGYFLLCCFYDTQCMDHTEDRTDNDIGASIGIIVINIVYTVGWILVIFVVSNYKLAMLE